jgi:hypothetical protein
MIQTPMADINPLSDSMAGAPDILGFDPADGWSTSYAIEPASERKNYHDPIIRR